MLWQRPVPQVRQTTMRPIVRPGASALARATIPTSPLSAVSLALAISVFAIPLAGGLLFGPVAAVVLVAAAVVAVVQLIRMGLRDVVGGPQWTFRGRPIDGQGFQLLEDIDARFAYAETHVRTLPTGIVWKEVEADVRALLWEAAEHGAELTALDVEIHEMRYAQAGTPQAALKSSLEDRRKAHWDIMRGIQWEAELLARTAGNAVAAARLALARTGSLAALRHITPSRQAIVAAGALAEARSRLELLAEVWAELDESGAIAAERLEADRRGELGSGS